MRRAAMGLGLGGLLLALGCGPTTYTRLGREPFHGARVQLDADASDGRTLVVVTVRDVEPPGRIASTRTHYVLWLVPPGQVPQRAGVLTYDPQRRIATGRGRGPGDRLTVIVTAESSDTPDAPSSTVVVEQVVVGG